MRRLFIFSVLIVAGDCINFHENGRILDVKTTKELRFAGTINGKTFVAAFENGTRLTWQQAKGDCEVMNMRLAELRSMDELLAIKYYRDAGKIPQQFYWVAGRDAKEARRFSWDSSNADVSSSNINVTLFPNSPTGCLQANFGAMVMYYTACDAANVHYICEFSTSTTAK